MLPIPDHIRIAGCDFTVDVVEPHPGVIPSNIGSLSVGEARIYVDGSIQDWRRRKVLLHELIHAADTLYGRGSLKEAETESIENGLWAIFNDNPGLAQVIFGDAA